MLLRNLTPHSAISTVKKNPKDLKEEQIKNLQKESIMTQPKIQMRAQMMNLKVRNKIIMLIDNERKHMVRSPFTIFPESSIKTAWDCMGFIFIVIQSISIPFHISFGIKPEGALLVFDTIIDVFFILDICKIFLNNSNKLQ